MNKKFSTLFAGVALLGATSVFAADNVTSLVEGTNSGLYQLKTDGGQFLSINEDGKLSVVDAIEADNVASTLWCVTVTEENKGKAPYFDFVNKGAEALLSITMEEFAAGATATTVAPEVGGEVSGWAFSPTYETLVNEKPLYSYFTTDSVVGFVVDNGTVVLKKDLASNAATTFTTTFSLVEADAVTLNAEQINTKLGIQKKDAGVKLTFTPDASNTSLKNPFSQELFLAAQVEGEDFVYITRKEDAKALFVDTAYINTTGSMFLAFNYMEDLDELKDSDLEGHGQFLFTYFPTNDSLVIQVKSIIKEPTAGSWAATTATSITDNDDDFNYVTVQDLVKEDQIRVVTIGEKKETDIVLGFTSCKESDTDRVSLEDGVYFIRNAKTNKYYASPIHIDGEEAQWVSVDADEQNVNHMPAYQWVVLKTKTSEYFAATSPVDVANREYAGLNKNYQFTQAEGSSKYFCEAISATDSLVITKITDANVLGDEHLGYKYLTKDELMITNYAFNYFNPYTMEKYIAQVAGSNKLNVLQDTPTYFEIKPVNGNVAADYGYKVTADVKKRINGLAQLKRESYTIHTKNAVIALGEENNFVITDKTAASKFFFKENNQLDATCYYAFVDAEDVNADGSFNFKAGVADQSLTALLQQQVINEVRTSAFSIGLTDQPLYRRFNNVKLDGAVEGNEDATKLLKFKEAYVNDYLMDETNVNFKREGMSYLGIGAANIAEAGLSFNVRPYNIGKSAQYNIKPQYLIYVSETVNEGSENIPCDATNHKHMNADGEECGPEDCIHATPAVEGFNRYKLLVSFADSTDTQVVTEKQLYKFGKYVRVGFVDAVEQDSVIYILGNTFATVATKDLSMDDVKKALEAKKISSINMKATVKEDKHHNYTWSFRYIDPTKAANEVEEDRAFLIESNAVAPIAPKNAAWIKNQNNCLVLSAMDASFDDAKTGGDAALIFNIEKGAADDMATDNESISASEVSVVATNGAVIIKGAEGKTVAISNVLGQTIANTVITSSEATISVPAGVVVVAVEGEAAVKAIVK
ncbi:hypothetical protein ACM15_17800 [Parabacteroides goldsteinii]|uniref:DUF6383 domain-containing protein n=2 Tax=Parabacteroides goldsteinii TaxID=328812 RepID=A0A0J6CJJ1_9BACT|nr:DUF6383 domain-containing protein [Parabacteroides sp. AF17-3]KMM32349.1 hypothetical protein ACM15_17800 [Parabacteroides goldsteinii]RKU73146.1 hypothetical protein DWW91_02530 [Parabacteroides sp. AF17-3]